MEQGKWSRKNAVGKGSRAGEIEQELSAGDGSRGIGAVELEQG